MLVRSLQTGSFALALLFASFCNAPLQAQYPFGASSCSSGFGAPMQSYYGNPGFGPWGQPGTPPSPYGNYNSNYNSSGGYAPPFGYGPQAPTGYASGYPTPALNVNQSFYPGAPGYNQAPQHYMSHHHASHHPWHLGHYLLGHH